MPMLNTRRWRQVRAAVLAASDICWICGRPGADTVDHIVPRAQGGTDHPTNLRPAHGRKIPGVCRGNYGRTPPRRRPGLNTSRRW